MRHYLSTLLVILTLASCKKDDDPIVEPIDDFPQVEVIPGKFVYVQEAEVFVMDDQGSEHITNTCNLNCFRHHPQWIDHGTKICYTQDFEGVFRVWEDGRYNTNVLAFQPNLWVDGAYSPNENLFVAADRANIYLYSVDEDLDLIPIDTVGYAPSSIGNKLIWSPDNSKILIYGSGNAFNPGQLHVLDIFTGQKSISLSYDDSPSWNSQSDKITFNSGNMLFTADADGGNIQQVNGTIEFAVHTPQWSPTGDKILCSGEELVLYDVAGGTATKLIDDENVISVSNAQWSADGQTIAFSMYYAEYGGLYVYQFSDQKIWKLSNKIIGPFDWYSE
jgi:Tol biopolymer transport system component